jgi:hypothetical protein
MKFFVPQAKPSEYEAAYGAIIATLKDQFGWKISDRRIASLHHIHDKREFRTEVGELDPHEHRYQVMAIFESNAYIVFTKTPDGFNGTTILVDKTEVLAASDFDAPKVRQV